MSVECKNQAAGRPVPSGPDRVPPGKATKTPRGEGMPPAKPPKLDPKRHARRVCDAIKRAYPEAACALDHSDPYRLLVATILSAQCTDARVNRVTPELFRRFPDSASLAKAEPSELEDLIHSTGFYRAKARNL